MTANQIARANQLETARSNAAREQETHRSNRANEGETRRHNLVTEGLTYQAQSETNRHNVVSERETERSNRAREAENYRSNVAREAENYRSNVARETETHRSNLATEGINRYKAIETKRHNFVTESETQRSNLATEGTNRYKAVETKRHNFVTEGIERDRQTTYDKATDADARYKERQATVAERQVALEEYIEAGMDMLRAAQTRSARADALLKEAQAETELNKRYLLVEQALTEEAKQGQLSSQTFKNYVDSGAEISEEVREWLNGFLE